MFSRESPSLPENHVSSRGSTLTTRLSALLTLTLTRHDETEHRCRRWFRRLVRWKSIRTVYEMT